MVFGVPEREAVDWCAERVDNFDALLRRKDFGAYAANAEKGGAAGGEPVAAVVRRAPVADGSAFAKMIGARSRSRSATVTTG